MNNECSLSTQDQIDRINSSVFFGDPIEATFNPHLVLFATSNKNRLIGAASKIFSIISQLKQRKKYQHTDKLRRYLLSEIHTFQENAKKFNYDHENILISCYVLSATLDEIINKTIWGLKSNWDQCNLLQEFQKEKISEERFFIILEKICQLPDKFIDTIELMYVCLSLGFEGKFREQNHKKQLQEVIDYTYQIIRSQRGDFEKNLSPSLKQKGPQINIKKRRIPLWGVVFFTGLILIGMYFSFNYLLNVSTDHINQELENIIHKN